MFISLPFLEIVPKIYTLYTRRWSRKSDETDGPLTKSTFTLILLVLFLYQKMETTFLTIVEHVFLYRKLIRLKLSVIP